MRKTGHLKGRVKREANSPMFELMVWSGPVGPAGRGSVLSDCDTDLSWWAFNCFKSEWRGWGFHTSWTPSNPLKRLGYCSTKHVIKSDKFLRWFWMNLIILVFRQSLLPSVCVCICVCVYILCGDIYPFTHYIVGTYIPHRDKIQGPTPSVLSEYLSLEQVVYWFYTLAGSLQCKVHLFTQPSNQHVYLFMRNIPHNIRMLSCL